MSDTHSPASKNENEEKSPVVKKKRGRKPKIVIDENSNQTDVNVEKEIPSAHENIPHIVQIKKDKYEDHDTEINFEKTFCDYSPDVVVPNAYDKDDSFCAIPSAVEEDGFKQPLDFMIKEKNSDSWPRQTDTYCFWCSHGFTNVPIGIPLKVFDGKFYCTGNFCSFDCAAAYNYNISNTNADVFEKQNLLNLMASKFKAKTPVRCAKPREMLKIFGGELDINEYRKEQDGTIYFSNKYPIVPIGEQVEEIHDSFSTQWAETFTIQKTSAAPKQKTMTEFV